MPSHFRPWHRYLHWITAICVISALILVETHDFAPDGSALHKDMMAAHMQFGLAVLLLFIPRLLLRVTSTKPPVEPPLPTWQKALSGLTHLALYGLMLALPVLGLVATQALGHGPSLFGLPMPTLVTPDKSLGHTLISLHRTLGNIILWLVVLHVAAALWHHFFRHDTTLRRMLGPRRKDAS
ncbi:cytochrome b [Oleiagrimonas sp. C23AA]|uniref:cytochrome b n=1 Tax=Oleiagrimonas sp. C23AA TaxID=2719047 RepID=UPI001421F237|nr:cytochrome b [Oleiagrimonas sp. C23AA]NII09745.1 cytochrome b [Oleiagrimonas sp. C23AA]